MKLTDANKIRDYVKEKINPYGKPFEGSVYEFGLKIMHYIDNMPADYDTDKVVKELEQLKNKGSVTKTEKLITNACVNKAIEIVKQGSVSDDMCEWERDEHSENDNPAKWIICPHKPKRIFSKDIKYCPYCGKKIMVVE